MIMYFKVIIIVLGIYLFYLKCKLLCCFLHYEVAKLFYYFYSYLYVFCLVQHEFVLFTLDTNFYLFKLFNLN